MRDVREHANEADDGRSENDYVKRREQEEDQGEDQLDADLCGTFLGGLPALGPGGFGVDAQRLRNAGAELVSLQEHSHECLDVIHLGARGEVLESLRARLTGADLSGDEPKLVSQLRVCQPELVGRLDDRLVQTATGLDADDEEVERIGEPVNDLLFTL